jgi:hypothetical protein
LAMAPSKLSPSASLVHGNGISSTGAISLKNRQFWGDLGCFRLPIYPIIEHR